MSFKDEGYFDKRPNGLSGKPSAKDNSIDKILGELLDQYEIGNNTVMECKYEAKAQLLAEILKGKEIFNVPEYEQGIIEAIPTQYVEELFKGEQ